MKTYDVLIIGAGTAGLSARREVAKKTSNYAVVDNGILGTTCARVGCMPSKILIEAANSFHHRTHFEKMGISGGSGLKISSSELMNHVRAVRDRFVRSVESDMNEWAPKHLIRKRATFVSKSELDLGGERVKAKSVIIATGSRPDIPEAWANAATPYLLDTDSFFELEILPHRIAVIGTGVIGLELGQALARLGLYVVAVGRGRSTFGGLTDPEIINYAITKMNDEFPIHSSGVDKMSVENGELVVSSGEKIFKVDKALVTIGRKPNVDKLNLDKIGITLNPDGLPELEEGTYRIKNTSMYLVGDANADRPILHEAANEGRIAGYNAVRDHGHQFCRSVKLAITFTSPNIAGVGKSHRDLLKEKIDFVVGEVSFEGQGRAIIKHLEKGILKIYAARESGLILGAEIFAPDGEHLAHLLAWAVDSKLTVADALKKPFYHPVIEEGLRTALRHAARQLPALEDDVELLRCEDPPVGSFAI